MKIFIKLFFCGGLTSLIFPPFFITPIGLLTLPYFFWVIIERSNQRKLLNKFGEGFFFGLGLNLFLFLWLKNPFLIEDHTRELFFLSYLLVFYLSIYYGIFSIILSFFKDLRIKLILLPALFVSIEIVKTKLFIAFPWGLFGYVFSNQIYLLQNVKFIGTYGLSYLVVITFLLPLLFYKIMYGTNKIFYFSYSLIIFMILGSLTIFSNLNYQDYSNAQKKQIVDVVIYQNNTPQIEKWDPKKMNKRMDNLLNFIQDNSKNKHNILLVLSETEIPYFISEDNDLLSVIQSKLDANTVVVSGAIRTNSENSVFYNTLYKISSEEIEFFDKKILVPFGEYLPLRNFLPFLDMFFKKSSEFISGNNIRSLRLFNDINFIPTICYENIFFENIIDKYNLDHQIIINITNDAWFGRYQGPYQHFYQSIVRSVEYGKYLIRVSNNGISAIVDPRGRILYSSKLNERISYRYSLHINNQNNYYSNNDKYLIFNVFLFLILSLSLLLQIFLKNEKL